MRKACLKLPTSGMDDVGEVFSYNGGIYRGINPPREKFYHDMFGGDLKNELFAAGLVPTEVTKLDFGSWAVVLKHRTLLNEIYPFEWSGEMQKDAAIMVCELERTLLRNGMTLKDGHPWNVMFEAGRPFFVDVGSIVPFEAAAFRHFARQFRRTFLSVAAVHQAGMPHVARSMLRCYRGFSHVSDYRQLVKALPFLERIRQHLLKRYVPRMADSAPIEAAGRLEREIRRVWGRPVNSVNGRERAASAGGGAGMGESVQEWLAADGDRRSLIFVKDWSETLTGVISGGARAVVACMDEAGADAIHIACKAAHGRCDSFFFDPEVSLLEDNGKIISRSFKARMESDTVIALDVWDGFRKQYFYSVDEVAELFYQLARKRFVLVRAGGNEGGKDQDHERSIGRALEARFGRVRRTLSERDGAEIWECDR
jgi:hypothetical protein